MTLGHFAEIAHRQSPNRTTAVEPSLFTDRVHDCAGEKVEPVSPWMLTFVPLADGAAPTLSDVLYWSTRRCMDSRCDS